MSTLRPLEVYGHDGKATNVTMEPGDMVLYESHSVLHGRPFPLKGRYMANLFVHFEPVGHSLRHNAKTDAGGDVHEKYRDALSRGHSGHENAQDGIPSYIVPGSLEETHWRQQHPDGQASGSKLKKRLLGPLADEEKLTIFCFLFIEIKAQVFRHWIHNCTRCSSGR